MCKYEAACTLSVVCTRRHVSINFRELETCAAEPCACLTVKTLTPPPPIHPA